MLYEDEGVGEDVICSAVEPSCPECPPGEDSVSSMPACMSEDELLGDVLPATPVVPNVLYTIGASSTYRGMLPGPLIGFAPPVGPCGTRAPCGISRHEDKNKDDTDGSEATGSRPVDGLARKAMNSSCVLDHLSPKRDSLIRLNQWNGQRLLDGRIDRHL